MGIEMNHNIIIRKEFERVSLVSMRMNFLFLFLFLVSYSNKANDEK